MNALQQVVAINNQATGKLQSGSIDTSVSDLERAMHMLRKISQELVDDDTLPQLVFEPKSTKSHFGFSPQCRTVDEFENDHCFVYNHLLQLSCTDAIDANGPDFDTILRLTSATIVFNAALLWHGRGKATGQTLPLRRAGQLYDVALTVLESTDGDDNRVGVLECLALNNRAAIHHELGNSSQSLKCMEYLRVSLSAGDCCLDAYLDPTEAEEIHLNAEFYQFPSAASAA